MKIDRHAERLRALEYAPELLVVEEAAARVTIDHRALETEPRDRAIELLHRGCGIRRGQRGKPGEAIGMRLHCLEQEIIDVPSRGDRRFRFERLTTRLIVREHLQVDTGGIHGGDTRVAEVEQRRDHVEAEQLLAVVAAMRAGGRSCSSRGMMKCSSSAMIFIFKFPVFGVRT